MCVKGFQNRKFEKVTNNYENCSKISSFLHGQRSAPHSGQVVLPHPEVDLHVDDDQVGEGDDASGEQPGPVDVVVHVGRVQSKTFSKFSLKTFYSNR